MSTSLGRIYSRLVLVFICSLSSKPLLAKTVIFVDTQGSPIPNVIVAANVNEAFEPDAAPVIMDQVNKAFEPSVLAIQKGQKVAFPNSDDIRHQVYSFSSPKPFEINLYSGTSATPIEFELPGIVVLGCNIHDNMVGYIYIADGEALWQSDKHGEVTLPSGIDKAMVWHPDLDIYHTKREPLLIQETTEAQIVTLELVSFIQSQGRKTFGSGKFGVK